MVVLQIPLLTFEEQDKNNRTDSDYDAGHQENLPPLELLFFPEFVHNHTGKLCADEKPNTEGCSHNEGLHRASNFYWCDALSEDLAGDDKKHIRKPMQRLRDDYQPPWLCADINDVHQQPARCADGQRPFETDAGQQHAQRK